MTDKVPREREQLGWWRPGDRVLCLWCGASFARPRVIPGVVLQACGKEACHDLQALYEERLAIGARMDRERRMALFDVEDVTDPERALRLRRVIAEHGVELVKPEGTYL